MVYVFHCCALADLPQWVKQNLQQRMEDWKQRSKTLVDQIHTMDPYYVPVNEYRFTGQVSYADIAAGRTNSPSSRNCSPYRHQREATPPVTTQMLQPAVTRAQKLTVEYPSSSDEAKISKTQESDASLNKSKSQRAQTMFDAEKQQDISEVVVESSVSRRGRSLTRKTSLSKVKESKAKVDQEREIDRHDDSCLDANSKQETQTKPARNTLALREERRGRSPSPMWVPGSTSYADILRGRIQATQVNSASAQSLTQTMVSLSGDSPRSRTEVPHAEQITVDTVANVDNKSQQVMETRQVVPTQEIEVEDARVAETYCPSVKISTEKAEGQNYAESESTNWADENLQDYNVLQHVNVPRQPQTTEIYDYIIPETMPELVDFIGSHLGTYPVSSYVYAPSGHHQQVQRIDTINLNPYNNGSLAYAPEHYIAQTTYLSASDIYQQTPMQQPVDDMRHTTAMLMEKPVEVPVVKQPEVSKDAVATERTDKSEQKSVNVSNVETSTTNKIEGSNTSLLNNAEIKGQTFSYAQILSQGLSSRGTSTRAVSDSLATNFYSKERSNSPKESLELSSRELSPLQESKLQQNPQSLAVTSEQSKKDTDWDTMKKREVKKRQQQSSDKTKQMDERKSRKSTDKPKEKRKKEKLSPPKQFETEDEESIPQIDNKIIHSPAQKEEEPVQQEKPSVDLVDVNPLQEKKHKQKKKKVDKSVGDEIDKALKEIEHMDKQKTRSQKDKSKEQNKEESESRDSINEIEKYKDEESKKQDKGEKKRLGKSKEVIRIKKITSMEHVTLPNQIKTNDQSILKENAKDEENISKKEKNKKSKELKSEAENSNREKFEDNIKGIIEDKSLKSTKLLIEIKNSELKANEVTKITDDVNESIKNKTSSQKRDKTSSKSKIKSEVTIDTSTVPASKVLNEIKINLNGMEKHDVPKSEQITDKTKIAETTIVEEIQKEIVLLPEVQQIAQEIVQIDNMCKNNKTYDSSEVKELPKNKEVEHQINAKLETESFTKENLETTNIINEKEAINSITKMIEKPEKREIEKGQTKPKKSEKGKSNIQDKNKKKEDNIKILELVENKSVGKKAESDIESLIAAEIIIQKQSTENLAEQHVSVSNNTCLVQSKTDAENNYGAKIDEGEDIAFDQVNKRAPESISKSKKKGKSKDKAVIQSTASIHNIKSESSKLKDVAETASTVSAELITPINREVSRNETTKLTKDDVKSGIVSTLTEESTIVPDLDISMAPENVEIIHTEILPKESKISSEINNTMDMKEKHQNVKNRKFDRQEAIKNEDINIDMNNKDSLIKEQDIKKITDVFSKGKTSKRTKKKNLGKVDTGKIQESLKKNEAEIEFDSKVPSDLVDKAQVYEKRIDEIRNNNLSESEQPPSTGKALIIEKMITTVTTTTSVPGSVKVKLPDIKSVKSVEIIENIPLPKIVGSKVTELITLRPETVEASLTTTYARIANDSLVNSHSVQPDQAAISQRVGLTSANSTESIVIADELAIFGSVRDRRKISAGISQNRDMSKKSPTIIASEQRKGELTAQLDDNMEGLGHQLTVEVPEEKYENNNMKKENAILTTTSGINVVDTISQNDNIIESQDINNSVKNDNIVLSDKTSQADLNIVIEEKNKRTDGNEIVVDTIAANIKKIADEKVEFEIKCENDCTSSKTKSEGISEDMKAKKPIVPEYLLELIKPYAIDRHAYNQAESNFYRHFKVIKIEKEPQSPAVAVQTRSKSIERIVQESVMKSVKSSSDEMHEIDCRRHASIIEAPKYPITSFYEFESQWIKMKFRPEKSVSISSDDSETSIKTAIEKKKQIVEEKKIINAISDLTENITAINVEKLKSIEINNEDKERELRDLQQSVHLVFDDSWMDSLDEPMMIEDDFDDTFNTEKNTINEAFTELNVPVEPSTEEISDNQLTDTDLNIQADETVKKNNFEIEREMLEIETKIPSIHLEFDDAWMALLEEEIIIDDDFDESETETVKDDQTQKKKKGIEKKEIIKQQEKEIEKKEPKTEILNNTSLTEIAVKDEYHTSVKDIQNETSCTDEKQSDRAKNQMKKKKESKHVKITRTKDQAKTAKKQSDTEIKMDTIKDDLSLSQSNLEENGTDRIKKAEKCITVDEVELHKDKTKLKLLSDESVSKPKSQDTIDDKKPKREERKIKSDKKFKKQNQKSKLTNLFKEKSAILKHESNVTKEDDTIISKVTKIESNICETSSIAQKQQELKDNMSKPDNRLNPNAKSWATIVGTRGVTETIAISKNDSFNIQTSSIQDTNNSITNITKQSQTIVHDLCEILPKEETFTMHSSSLDNQIDKNIIEELKTAMMDEIVKSIPEKSTVPSKQLKEGNKSYAQVTASSRRISPQTSQEETYSIKPIPLKTDHLATNVKTSDEMREDFNTEKLQSSSEQKLVQQFSDHQTITESLISQEESIPWVEEVEKEALDVSTISVNFTNMIDNETHAKQENTWAAIVGKKSVESSEIKDIPNLEQNLSKSEQIVEQWSSTQVQIYVEEVPKQEPIENLVQVDEQGFMEFVNRKELRSRRSRSRSRSAKRDNKYGIVDTSNSRRNKEIKMPDIKSEDSENVKAEDEIENKTKRSVKKHENEQKIVDESAKIIKEENVKPSEKICAFKSKDKNKQKINSNERDDENKMQFAENKIHDTESKIIQEIKSELNVPLKGKKNKLKKNKSKDSVQQQEINEQKELKQIEKSKEDKKSANENEMEYNKIQLENIEDQSIKGTQLIKDTKNAQENKNVEASIIDQDNSTKSKKKKNKKGKPVIEQVTENTSDIDKKIIIARDLEEKIKSIELKLDDEVKLEEATDICNIPTDSRNEETPTEIINKHENIMQDMAVKTTEQGDIERKMTVDESKNTESCKKVHLEQVEKNVMDEEISQPIKAEKQKQKKNVQSKSTDLSDNINVIENIKTKETVEITEEINIALLKDKIDDEFILKKNDEPIQSAETEKPLKKFEAVVENKASSPQIASINDKQKAKGKFKSKKEKRQQDDKTKSQNLTILTGDSKEMEALSTAENTDIINLSEDKQNSIKCSKEDTINITDEIVSIANKTIHEISKETESSVDFTEEEKNNIVSIEFVEKLEISNNEKEQEKENKYEINEKQVEMNDAEKLTINSEKTELYDVTVNNDITKIESVILDKTKNSDEIGTDTSASINPVPKQIESSCDSINAVIKHSPPSNKLSSVVQQSFEDEEKLKRVASIEQENSDLPIECPKSKVQFYIADEILVLSPDRRKHVLSMSLLQEQSTTDLCSFLSIDDGFWPDKRSYHEAERDHFESLASDTKKNLPRDSDFDDRHHPRDRDDDNLGGGGSNGRPRDSCGDSRSLLGTPQTERMIADLPGGMCSWSDYSTYLSSESERTVDHGLPLSIESPTFDSGLSLDYSLPNDVQPSSAEFLSSFPSAHNPQTESRMESLVDAEVIPRERPTAASSDSFRSPDHPSTCTKSSTFAHLRPRSKLHLGNEMREGSVQQCSPNGEMERETARDEAERIRRIQVRSPLRPVLGLVLVEFEPSPLPYVYIHAYVYILVVFSYLDCLPLIFRSLCLSFCNTTTFSFSCSIPSPMCASFLCRRFIGRAYINILLLHSLLLLLSNYYNLVLISYNKTFFFIINRNELVYFYHSHEAIIRSFFSKI